MSEVAKGLTHCLCSTYEAKLPYLQTVWEGQRQVLLLLGRGHFYYPLGIVCIPIYDNLQLNGASRETLIHWVNTLKTIFAIVKDWLLLPKLHLIVNCYYLDT